ncbi:MAG: recombinase family protein [Oscillospiraceae bacterium]|nr:recombinase family protein [Oscillospiraceae bacterium]
MIAFYIRLSRLDDDLDERKQLSNSVENQRRLLSDYLSEMPDLRNEDVEEFIDDGYSGTNFERPAFQRMLGLIKKRTVDTVIVKDFSRFGRNYVECADYIEKLFPFLGTRFISVTDSYDSGRQDDCGIDFAMKNIVNSYYSRDLSLKVVSAFDVKRENGEFFFGVPFGYLKDEEHPGKVLIDDEAAATVRLIFTLACEDRTTGEIAKILNRENVPTVATYNREHRIKGKACSSEKSDFAAWTGTKVMQILKNEVYTGTYILQKRRCVVAGSKKSVAIDSPKKIPDNHPAIVSAGTFAEAQKIFTGRRKKSPESRRYQLKSKVFCGNCGYAMAYKENVYDECFFRCSHSGQTGLSSGCPDDRFSEELLNELVFRRLRQWMKLLEVACGKAEEAERNRIECLELLGEEAAELQAELGNIESQKLALYESYASGEISREGLALEKKKLSEESDSIRSALAAVHERESRTRALRNRRKPELDVLMENVRLFGNETRLTCKMAETFVEKVIIYDKWQVDIEWKGEELTEISAE